LFGGVIVVLIVLGLVNGGVVNDFCGAIGVHFTSKVCHFVFHTKWGISGKKHKPCEVLCGNVVVPGVLFCLL
jgi:hypothetical protein